MTAVIIWVLCAFVGYSIAESKNRNAMGWGLICFLFGIFGVIAIALLPKLDNKEE